MSVKQMKFKANAQAELKRGVDQIAQAVAVTMGPTWSCRRVSAAPPSPRTA